MAAALIITHPELFSDEKVIIDPTRDSLKTGDINVAKLGKTSSMPGNINDVEKFNGLIFEAFDRLQLELLEKAALE